MVSRAQRKGDNFVEQRKPLPRRPRTQALSP